jgi:hypothetical protein
MIYQQLEWWPETALFSDAYPLSDTDDRERTGPTPQYRGLGRLNSLKLRSLRIGCFYTIAGSADYLVHRRRQVPTFSATWSGLHLGASSVCQPFLILYNGLFGWA